MTDHNSVPIVDWTVDYHDGRGPHEARVPHAWRQDVEVTYEGPVTYRTHIDVPDADMKLVFHGVSYEAQVSIGDQKVYTHTGIWDAFEVPLAAYRAQTIELSVQVVKNGGETYPVKEVASGFLPFVFHTFGGIYADVEMVDAGAIAAEEIPAPPTRVGVDGCQITVDGRPFFMRGLLHWGWYPLVGHTNPPDDTIRAEVQKAKALGFNLVKFCLWVPSHRYLEILREEGMEAWIELPLWDPTSDPERLDAIALEMERIVRQYRRHDNVIVWTVGCELSESTPAAFREQLVRTVKNLTGCPLVKDNSGGAEMYGGDLREYGDFYDFHPYCDTPFYPAVLDSLMPGPRKAMPVLLGEFNDIDAHRDLDRLGHELPYWVSALPELNDQGVRWQHDMPTILHDNRFVVSPKENGHAALMESSRQKALFIRKTVHEAVRSHREIAGYCITGWRDTPISTAGLFDDWDQPRYSPRELATWNGPDCLYIIPTRRPPFVLGGNRPGYLDSYNLYSGQAFWRIGVHSVEGRSSGLVWRIVASSGRIAAHGACPPVEVPALSSAEVGEIVCDLPAGDYVLQVEFAGAGNEWPIWVVDRPDWATFEGWSLHDPRGVVPALSLPGGPWTVAIGSVPAQGVGLLLDEGTIPMPFWRESADEFLNDAFWQAVPFRERWSRFLAVSPDRALDPAALPDGCEILLNRIDTRTYKEHPILVRCEDRFVTTLRPFGGLGVQPTSLAANPAGSAFLAALMSVLSR